MPSSRGLIRWSTGLIGRSESTGAPLSARVAALSLLTALGVATAAAQSPRPNTTVSQPTGAASSLATLRSPPVLESISGDPRTVEVRLTGTDEDVHLSIEDDGIGFDLAELERHAGLGFVSMRERLRLLNGTVHVDSAPGRGTRIDVAVPVTTESSDGEESFRGEESHP